MKKNDIKSKMTIEERLKRRKQLQKSVAKDYAKTEQINFRIDEKSVVELMNVAAEKGQPLGTLIREWILERLAQEKTGLVEPKDVVFATFREIYEKLHKVYEPGVAYRAQDGSINPKN